ncbi:MFS transporter [Embleya scabrispora]|uniref:MFS transporter n=1 Tax=Embleya scabrispora TaxID=159449 RepID=UPI0003637C3D|nr:MFS transporter [Embleya scabrispora]MYS79231.1 MFS transporter [Streptomyces sp. SID5474]
MHGPRSTWILATCLLGVFVTTLPVTLLTISVGRIARDVHSVPSVVSWTTTAPMLAAATAMPLFGRLGDIHGHRQIYLLGLATATLFAGATAFAWDAPSLIAFRTLSQTGAAAMVPSTYATLFATFTEEKRVRASSLAGATQAAAAAGGLVVGGPLVDLIGWRALFLAQAGAAAAALVAGAGVLPATRRPGPSPSLDLPGACLLGVTTFSVTFGLNRLLSGSPALALPILAVAPVSLLALVGVERRARHPLLPLHLLTDRDTAVGCGVSFVVNIAWMGNFVTAPLLLQSVFGLSTTATSLVSAPRTSLILAAAPASAALSERRGERRVVTGAAIVLAAVSGGLSVASHLRELAPMAVLLAASGLALGLVQPPLVSATIRTTPPDEVGLVVSLQQTANQIGGVVGIGAGTAIAADATTPQPFVIVFALSAGLFAAAALLSTRLRRRRSGRPVEVESQ